MIAIHHLANSIRDHCHLLKENPHNITNWPKYDPEEFDNILKPGLCVFLECIMRFYNESSREKYWFLDSIQALANNISKL